ncbi:MAG: DsbA family protein [Vicinamibacterales bacterium]
MQDQASAPGLIGFVSRVLALAVQLAFLVAVGTLVYVVFFRQPPARPAAAAAGGGAGEPVAIEGETRIPVDAIEFRGSPAAKVVVGEFADVDCPYCLRWVSGARPAFEKRFVESGQVRFAFFQLPLPMHPGAEAAAVAMECAGSQGAFWPMHDLLFRPDRPRDRDGFVASAAVLDLDSEMFGKCLTNPPPKVGRDQALAAELGINGTPTFIVGTFDADGAIRPRFKIVGAPNERRLADLIKQLVAN